MSRVQINPAQVGDQRRQSNGLGAKGLLLFPIEAQFKPDVFGCRSRGSGYNAVAAVVALAVAAVVEPAIRLT